MASRHLWASVALILAAVGWAAALFIEPGPWDERAGGVIAAGLVLIIAVAVAAVMIEASRLGYWLGAFGLALMLTVAGLRPVDAAWMFAIAATAVAAVLMADRRLGGWVRSEGPVAPVPAPATALGILLLVAPPATAVSLADRPGGAIVWLAVAAWAVLAGFARRAPGAVTAVRLGIPVLAAGSALLSFPGAVTWAALMVSALVLAWSKPVRLAIRPLIERGSRISIPPELLPDDVRRASGIDRDLR